MTICNMSIEAGARAGMIAPDETTFAYLKGRRFSPQGAAWDEAVAEWRKLPTDPGAKFDRELVIDAADARALRHLGHQPRHGRARHRHRSRSPPTRQRSRPQVLRARARIHGPEGRHAHRRHHDRPRLHRLLHQLRASKTCAPPPQSSPAITSPRTSARWSCPARSSQSAGRSTKASTTSSARPASSGASPAAPCAWA